MRLWSKLSYYLNVHFLCTCILVFFCKTSHYPMSYDALHFSNLSHVLIEDCLPAETYRCWPESPSRIMKQLGPTFFSYMQSTISFTWPESRFLRKSLSRMASRMSCLDLKRTETQESREKRKEGKLRFDQKRQVSRLAIQHFSNVKSDRLSMISCILLPINLSNIQFVIFFTRIHRTVISST